MLEAYLRRLSLEAEPPSAEALTRLHRRHAERIPYETLWIHGGERWGINPHDAATRIAFQHRSGYCHHLNGAFAALLHALGSESHSTLAVSMGLQDQRLPMPETTSS